jgi:hypothetical protein
MKIEIIATPVGPAPEEFRKAWIGIILSVGAVFYLPPCGCPFWVEEVETIQQAKELGLLNTSPDALPAFIVPLIPAMQKLAAKSEDAVRWWENRWREKEEIKTEFDVFLFRKDACRIV